MKKTYVSPVLNDEEIFEMEESIMIEGSTEQQEIEIGDGTIDVRMLTDPASFDVLDALGFKPHF